MKKLLITALAFSGLLVGCHNNNPNNTGINHRSDDTHIQRQEDPVITTPTDQSQGTSSSANDIQREEDVTGGALNTDTPDMEETESSVSGEASMGSDMGTNRGAGSAAGSNDAAGMGMDE